LGYSDKETESQYMDMTQAYKATDVLLQSNNFVGQQSLSIQKTASDIVMPEVTGTTGFYLAKTTDLVLSMFVDTSTNKADNNVVTLNENIQIQEDTQSLYDYLQTTNMNYSPGSVQECQQSIDFSNTPEVLEQVQQAMKIYSEEFGVDIDPNTRIVFMSGTKAKTNSACACCEQNTIIIPVDNFDNVPDAQDIYCNIAHEYTHILNYPKVKSGKMTQMNDEVMATENGIIADTTHSKNLTIQTMYNDQQTVNFISGMELSCFYSIINNQDEIVDRFRQITGKENIQFADIYYHDVVYGQNDSGIPTSKKVGETEVGITLEYDGIKILYITDTGMNVNGTYENISVDGEVSHRIEFLSMAADKDIIETTMGYYTNGTFTRDDIINSFEQVVVSEILINDAGRKSEFGKFDISNLDYICYDFPVDSAYAENGDVIRFYVADNKNNNTYTIDVKKDMGIVQIQCVTDNNDINNTIWAAPENLSKSLYPPASSSSSLQGGGMSMSMTTSVIGAKPPVSDYKYIHDLSATDLQKIVEDSNSDVTTRYLAFLKLKAQGENVAISNDMKEEAKEYLTGIMNGDIVLITEEEKENLNYETAADRLKAALAMVYDIMLDSYISEFNIDDETIDQIWSDIYNNAKVYEAQSGFATSNFSFQIEAMTPDVMAHEIMHNISDVYLSENKNITEKSLGEFSSDVAGFIICEQLGVDIPQRMKNQYKEYVGYMRTGYTPIEEHAFARGVIGMLMEAAINSAESIDWKNMMSAVAQCLQSNNFTEIVETNDYSQSMIMILSQYVAVSSGNHSAVIVSIKNETMELCNNILNFFNFAQF
jgi:hypothetical protein